MKNKLLLISALVLFVIINTSYFWSPWMSIAEIPFFLFLIVVYIILACATIYQAFLAIGEKFKNRSRVISVVAVMGLLFLMFLKPEGIINFDRLEGKDLLIADREGSANCLTILKLKETNRFIESGFCFGTTEVRGKFDIKGDTVFFSDIRTGRNSDGYYKFGVIRKANYQNKKIINEIARYRDYNDSTPHILFVTYNSLKK